MSTHRLATHDCAVDFREFRGVRNPQAPTGVLAKVG
jgi:hypothetical protein